MASETNTKKRSRETEKYILVHLVSAYGDTSSFNCIVHEVTGEDDPHHGEGAPSQYPDEPSCCGDGLLQRSGRAS